MKKIAYFLIVFLCFIKNTEAQTELVSTGTGAAYVVSYPAAFSYSSGITITFKAHAASTAGPVTLDINALGARTIKKNVTADLALGDIILNQFVTVIYDGTNFQLTSPSISPSAGNQWNLTGNLGTTTATDFIGTKDATALVFKTNDAERIRLSATGNLGLGTINPIYKLHLYSTANNGSDILSETDAGRVIKHWFINGGRSWSIGQTGTAVLPQYSFAITDETAGVNRLAITTAGNVGVGTPDPNATLNINHSTNSQLRLNTTALGNSTTDGLLIDLNNSAGSINLYENLPLYFATNGTNKMAITAAGNVGIGTSAPLSLFSVGATNQFQVNSAGDIASIKGLAYTWPNAHVSGFLQNDGAGNLSFGALPAGANAWTKSGTVIYNTVLTDNVGIGTTTPGTSKLNVTIASGEASATTINATNNYTGASAKYGLSVNVPSGGTGLNYGVDAQVTANSGVAATSANFNMAQLGAGTAYGIENRIQAFGTGYRAGILNLVESSASNSNIVHGISNTINTGYNAGFSQTYGVQNIINNPVGNTGPTYGIYTSTNNQGSGSSVGYYTDYFTNGTGARIGFQSSINTAATNTGDLTGLANNVLSLANTGTGSVKGVASTLSNTSGSTGSLFGVENVISVGNNATSFGMYNTFTSSGGNGIRYGVYNSIGNANGATGALYGTYNQFFQNGTAPTFGVYNDMSNTSATAGTKYGVYSDVRANAANTSNQYGNYVVMSGTNVTGTKYGVYVTGENSNYFSGEVGIGTTSPTVKLDVEGDLALRQVLASDAAAFNPLDVTNRSLINMNALTSNFEIRSIRGTGDGKILTIINPTSFSMSIRDQSAAFGLGVERIITGTGGTVTYPGPCVVTLVYNITSTRWFISSVASGASNANLWSKTGAMTYLTNSTDFVGIGTSTPTERIHIQSIDSDIDAETVSAIESSSLHIKRAAGTLAVPTLVPNGQYFGGVSFQGYDGTAYREAARMQASVDGVTAANDMPGRLEFWTTPDGTNTALERMRLTNSGNLGIGTTTPGATRLNLTIPNTDATNPIGLTINNNYIGASDKFGIDVNVDGAGSGQKFGISSSVVGLAADASSIYGYQVLMTPNGTGTAYGVYSQITAVGTGTRYGFYNNVAAEATSISTVYGIRNVLSGAAATKYGIYNQGEDRNYFSGDVGIGIAAPLVKLDVNGSMALRKPADINLATGAQIDPATTSYVRFTGGGGTYTLGNPSILSGSVAGQMLILTSNHGGTTIVQHAGIVRLAGGVNYSMGAYDSLTLIWDGTFWIELSRSNNQ